ncbi:MAG: hypothetical protein IJ233_04270, partial [Pyramidobacter sp.]|nr:hypothetical protein [Pyramidobacter sp.]
MIATLMKKTLLCLVLLALTAGRSCAAVPSPQTLAPFVTGLGICGTVSLDARGNTYISEWSSERVGIYSPEGKLIGAIEDIGDPSGNVFDPDGNFYVSSYSYGRVWRVAPDGTKTVYADGFSVPAGLAWIDGCLHVCSRDAGQIVRIEPDGSRTVIAGGLPQPVALIKMKGGSFIISCLAGSPRRLAPDGTLTVFIPEISSSDISMVPDGDDAFIMCVISGGTV